MFGSVQHLYIAFYSLSLIVQGMLPWSWHLYEACNKWWTRKAIVVKNIAHNCTIWICNLHYDIETCSDVRKKKVYFDCFKSFQQQKKRSNTFLKVSFITVMTKDDHLSIVIPHYIVPTSWQHQCTISERLQRAN